MWGQKVGDISWRVCTAPCHSGFGLATLGAFQGHRALHVPLCGLPARQGQGQENITQPPRSWLVCSCLRSSHWAAVGLAVSPILPLLPLPQPTTPIPGSISFIYAVYRPEPFRLGREQAQRAICIPVTSTQCFYRYSSQHRRTRAMRKQPCNMTGTRWNSIQAR